MKNETDSKNLIVVSDGLSRWAPLVVVLGVVGGFITLSWYAYHAGVQSVKEEDLVVVEADKSPIKEKPLDPGGMQFPNQDKTVFETFSGNSHAPAKVERVLPVPEEPMAKETEGSETTTWVNKELPKKGSAEQVIGKEPAKKADEHVHVASSIISAQEKSTYTGSDKANDHQIISSQQNADEDQSVTYVAPKNNAPVAKPTDTPLQIVDNKKGQPFAPEKAVSARSANEEIADKEADEGNGYDKPTPSAKADTKVEKVETKTLSKPVKPVEVTKHDVVAAKPAKAVPAPHIATGGSSLVQLGAYRSQAEADAAWDKMHLKQKLLSDKSPNIVKVNLGSKGIYYRLRVGGLASAADAKSLCHALSSSGQPCIIPNEK